MMFVRNLFIILKCVVLWLNILLMFDLMYCGINVLATNLLFNYSKLLWLKKGQILVDNTETYKNKRPFWNSFPQNPYFVTITHSKNTHNVKLFLHFQGWLMCQSLKFL